MRPLVPVLLLSTLCGCGLLFLNGPIGKDERGRPVYPPDDEPPHSMVIEGEIRDFLTLHAESHATIEVWTSDPGYRPAALVDENGHFILRIDLCRKDADVGEQLVANALVGGSHRCHEWLDQFRFRARLGDRCSVTYGSGLLPGRGKPLDPLLQPGCREEGP